MRRTRIKTIKKNTSLVIAILLMFTVLSSRIVYANTDKAINLWFPNNNVMSLAVVEELQYIKNDSSITVETVVSQDDLNLITSINFRPESQDNFTLENVGHLQQLKSLYLAPLKSYDTLDSFFASPDAFNPILELSTLSSIDVLYASNLTNHHLSVLASHKSIKDYAIHTNQGSINTKLTDVSPLLNRTDLIRLAIAAHNVTDVSGIENNLDLEYLELNTGATDYSNVDFALIAANAPKDPLPYRLTTNRELPLEVDALEEENYFVIKNPLKFPKPLGVGTIHESVIISPRYDVDLYDEDTDEIRIPKEKRDELFGEDGYRFVFGYTAVPHMTDIGGGYLGFIYLKVASEIKTSTVTSHYVDENGVALQSPETITGNVGSDYSTSAKEFPGYELVNVVGSETGVFTDMAIEVTYQYKKLPVIGTVITHYVDENGAALQSPETITGNVGSDYSTSAREFPGYELVNVVGSKNGVFTDTTIEVTYQYKKIPVNGTVIAHYVDENGQPLQDPVVITGKVGTEYNTDVIIFEEYDLVDVTGEWMGRFTEETIEVIYHYKKITVTNTVTAYYVDENGVNLQSPVVTTGVVGTGYNTYALEFEGYELVKVVGVETGVYTETGIEVTYHYKKIPLSSTVTTYYVDENGVEIQSPVITTGTVGTEYSTSALKLEGYELVKVTGEEVGVYTEVGIEVTYHYKKTPKTSTVIAHYVDENGEALQYPVITTGLTGSNYKTSAIEFPGYELIKVSGSESGVYTDAGIEVTYHYKKIVLTSNVTAHYVDENGVALIDSVITSGPVGSSYRTSAQIVAGYELVSVTGLETGVYTETGIEVTYHYKKIAESSEEETLPNTGLSDNYSSGLILVALGMLVILYTEKKKWLGN